MIKNVGFGIKSYNLFSVKHISTVEKISEEAGTL